MSQNVDLGPGSSFMLCEKCLKLFVHYFFFYLIKMANPADPAWNGRTGKTAGSSKSVLTKHSNSFHPLTYCDQVVGDRPLEYILYVSHDSPGARCPGIVHGCSAACSCRRLKSPI